MSPNIFQIVFDPVIYHRSIKKFKFFLPDLFWHEKLRSTTSFTVPLLLKDRRVHKNYWISLSSSPVQIGDNIGGSWNELKYASKNIYVNRECIRHRHYTHQINIFKCCSLSGGVQYKRSDDWTKNVEWFYFYSSLFDFQTQLTTELLLSHSICYILNWTFIIGGLIYIWLRSIKYKHRKPFGLQSKICTFFIFMNEMTK